MSSYSAVVELKNGMVYTHGEPVEYVGEVFSKGFYETRILHDGRREIKRVGNGELHPPFESEETKEILDTVKAFFKEETKETINKLGFTHKLGILLHGIAGTGKTSLLTYIANYLVEELDAVVLFGNTFETLGAAMTLGPEIRKIQDNPIIVISDEFERFAIKAESEVKNFLDGKDSINNSLFLATTNYLKDIPETLKNRPSRFRVVTEIKGITNKKDMYQITRNISEKISPSLFTEKEIKELYSDITSITLDEIKHKCLDKVTNTFVKTKKRTPIGFTTNNEKTEDDNKIKLEWTKNQLI